MSDLLLNRKKKKNWRVLTDSSDPFSVFWSEGGCGGVGRRRGGDGGRAEPDLCCFGTAILGDKTGDLWTGIEEGGLGDKLVAIAVVEGITARCLGLVRRKWGGEGRWRL